MLGRFQQILNHKNLVDNKDLLTDYIQIDHFDITPKYNDIQN